MKKLKITCVIASVLCLVMLCTSCGTSTAKIADYLNPDYVPEELVVKQQTSVSELAGFTLNQSNSYFAIFEKTPLASIDGNPTTVPTTTYKVFSMVKGSVIATLSAANTTYDFELFDGIPLMFVKSVYVDLLNVNSTTINHVAYDAAGAQIASSKNALAAPYAFADLVIFNYAAYAENEDTGALTKQLEVSEFLQLDECDYYNENYFYIMDEEEIIVYDREFNLVSTWSAPSYADANMSVLNDGNVLVQYTYELDSEATKYDFYEYEDGVTTKYELVSLLYNTVKGSVKELDLDFVVAELVSNEYLQRDAEEENAYYADKFENLAYICPIVDKQVDYSEDAIDLVLMNNKAKVQKSLKILDDQAVATPEKVDEDLYSIRLKNGYALVDGKGNLINVLNSSFRFTNDYIIGEAAIYNFDLTKAYDLIANDADVISTMDDTIFVRANTSNGYNIVVLGNGTQKTVYTYDKTRTDVTLAFGSEISNGIYYTYDAKLNTYNYYNVTGTSLITTKSKLEFVGDTSGDKLLLVGMSEQLVPSYYVFTKN